MDFDDNLNSIIVHLLVKPIPRLQIAFAFLLASYTTYFAPRVKLNHYQDNVFLPFSGVNTNTSRRAEKMTPLIGTEWLVGAESPPHFRGVTELGWGVALGRILKGTFPSMPSGDSVT